MERRDDRRICITFLGCLHLFRLGHALPIDTYLSRQEGDFAAELGEKTKRSDVRFK